MLPSDWQLQTPLDAIFFDCDGTLSRIEGIDELAAMNGVAGAVKKLTHEAMGLSGVTQEIYRERLLLAQPGSDQMPLLADMYIKTVTEDAVDVISIFRRFQKKLFILSAGLLPAILPFARYLGISDTQVYAVDVRFDDEGNYLDYDRQSPLAENLGKSRIVENLCQRHARAAYIGDGMNDCPVQHLVTRFVGYGGACYRNSIATLCGYYIRVESLAPFLVLTLTQEEHSLLASSEQKLYQKGLDALQKGGVEIREEKLA